MKKEERQETEYFGDSKSVVLTGYRKVGALISIIQIYIKSQLLLHKDVLNYIIFIVQ